MAGGGNGGGGGQGRREADELVEGVEGGGFEEGESLRLERQVVT